MPIQPNPKARKKKLSAGTVGKQVASGTKNYIRDELLGIDDFKRVGSKAKSGDVLGAAKSGLTGVGELGLTAASVVAGFFSGGTGAVGVQAAKVAAKEGVKKAAKTTAATGVSKEANKAANKTSSSLGNDIGRAPERAPKNVVNYADDIGRSVQGGVNNITGYANRAVRGGLDDITKLFKNPSASKGNQFKDDGDYYPGRYVAPRKPPLKPVPSGGETVKRGITITEAPPSSRGMFKPDTKVYNPYAPKTAPLPGKAPQKAPTPRPRPAIKPTPPALKPDAAKPALGYKPQTQTQTQTQLKPVAKTSTKTAVKTSTKPPIKIPVPPIILPNQKSDPDKGWVPSAIV